MTDTFKNLLPHVSISAGTYANCTLYFSQISLLLLTEEVLDAQ